MSDMIDKEKQQQIKELADGMYYAEMPPNYARKWRGISVYYSTLL